MPTVPPSNHPAVNAVISRSVRAVRIENQPRPAIPGHQTVPRTWSQPGPNVEASADANQEQAAEQGRPADQQRIQVRDHQHGEIDHDSDSDDVQDCADTQALTQGNPGGEHQQPDKNADRSDGNADPVRYSLVEDLPRAEPEVGFDHQSKAEANHNQAKHELGETPAKLSTGNGDEHGSERSHQVSSLRSLTLVLSTLYLVPSRQSEFRGTKYEIRTQYGARSAPFLQHLPVAHILPSRFSRHVSACPEVATVASGR